MDTYKMVSRISKIFGYGSLFAILLMLVSNTSLVFAGGEGAASTGASGIGSALAGLCDQVKTFLGAAMVLMILLAAITYSVGQIMGAETRARATVWATAMLTGAVIGAIIYIITPYVIQMIIGSGDATGTSVGSGSCTATGAAAADE